MRSQKQIERSEHKATRAIAPSSSKRRRKNHAPGMQEQSVTNVARLDILHVSVRTRVRKDPVRVRTATAIIQAAYFRECSFKDAFILDSACTQHISKDRANFVGLREIDESSYPSCWWHYNMCASRKERSYPLALRRSSKGKYWAAVKPCLVCTRRAHKLDLLHSAGCLWKIYRYREGLVLLCGHEGQKESKTVMLIERKKAIFCLFPEK